MDTFLIDGLGMLWLFGCVLRCFEALVMFSASDSTLLVNPDAGVDYFTSNLPNELEVVGSIDLFQSIVRCP